MMRKITLLIAAAAFAVAGLAHAADAPKWVAGEHYEVIDPALPTRDDGKVDVVEVFSYACPHCAHFQPYAKKLKASLPEGVVFLYKPAVFSKAWEPFARAYLTAKAMGVADESHQALFDALHRDHKPIRTLEDLSQFYAQFGVDPGQFMSTAQSFVINNELTRDVEWEQKAGIRGTPTLIVNGKYRVVGSMAGGYKDMIDLTLWLVNKELAAQSKD